jgi:hypothetical protein
VLVDGERVKRDAGAATRGDPIGDVRDRKLVDTELV